MNSKYKLLMISDIPLANSGVGTQTKYIIDYLVKTGKYKITCFGGAVKHQDYNPVRIKEWGEDVTIIPVDGYGNKNLVRQALDIEKVDAIWIMTDPRFYVWLFQMSDEIKQCCPLIWWTIWDNADEETWPKYNKSYYDSCSKLIAINKLTYKFLMENGWADRTLYIPHGVPSDDYRIMKQEEIIKARKIHFGILDPKDSFIVFYNSRNALRKRTGTVMMAYKRFLQLLPENEQKKCFLAMKTPPKDPEGQDLFVIVKDLGLENRVAFSDGKYPNNVMAEFYNASDVTISLSSEEGFGLSVLESLMCGTPVICTRTGGMQDQMLDPKTKEEFGFCLEPDARSLIGSQTTPYIWSDHVDCDKAARALHTIYRRYKTSGDHKEFWAGTRARESMLRRFSMEKMQRDMDKAIEDSIIEFKQNRNGNLRVIEI